MALEHRIQQLKGHPNLNWRVSFILRKKITYLWPTVISLYIVIYILTLLLYLLKIKQGVDCHRPSEKEVRSKQVLLKKASALTPSYTVLTVTGLHVSRCQLMTGWGQVTSFLTKVAKAMALKRVRRWISPPPAFFQVLLLGIQYKPDTEAVFRAKWTITLVLNGNRHVSSFHLVLI